MSDLNLSMISLTSVFELYEKCKTDVRYKWLLMCCCFDHEKYNNSFKKLNYKDFTEVPYPQAKKWLDDWIAAYVTPTKVYPRGYYRNCSTIIRYINRQIVNIIDRDGTVLKPEFNSDPEKITL